MKRIMPLILVVILILSVTGIAFASNIDNAEYKTTIAITNNSTAATNVAVPFTLSTSEMIAGGMLSANASDAAMISSGGSDTAFMPSSDNTHPWVTWVSSIGTESQVLHQLYSKGASGGMIRYFPSDVGMSANNSATLQLADNFTIEQKGWLDTSYSANKSLVLKPNAFSVNITAPETITAMITNSFTLVPNGANTTGIDSFTGAATHWQAVASADNSTSYVFTENVGGQTDTYTTADHGINGDITITSVDAVGVFQEQAGDLTGLIGVEVLGQGSNSGYDAITAVWAEITHNMATVPGTGANWTLTDINAVNIKVGLKGNGAGQAARCTYAYIRVNYSVAVTASGIPSGNTTVRTQYQPNLLTNSSFETGDPPTGWTPEGAGASVSRTSGEVKVGTYSANLTRGGTDCRIFQAISNPNSYVGTEITIGKWVKTDTANRAHISIRDSNGQGQESLYHTGSNEWEWLSVSYTPLFSLSGGWLRAECRVYNGDISAYFDSAILIVGDSISDYNTFRLFIDGVEEAQTYTEVAVPSNSSNWTFFQNGAMPYVEYHKIWCGETLQQHIIWQYATTFDDQSAGNHDATPTFRTVSSDDDVSAEVTAQEGLIESSVPSTNVSGGWTMITSVPASPDQLFSEGGDDYAIGDFNIGELVTGWAASAGHPAEPYHFLLAFGIAFIVILAVFGATHNTRAGRQGSLLLAFLAGGLVLVVFYRFETIPGWTLIPYGLGSILLIMWRRSPSPVD